MSYQTPITIHEAIRRIHRHDYVLPAIQREFVWSQERIARLFDSLLQGYPFGAFLFWEIPPEHASAYKYYDFMLHYHERKRPHCEPVSITPGTEVTAVLDGQQRLTSFNIGLRGSHAVKEPRKWYNNPDAYLEKKLYLNLLAEAEQPNDLGMIYDFRFLTPEQAEDRTESVFWFPVGRVLEWEDADEAFAYLVDHDLFEGSVPKKDVYTRATRLYRAVIKEGTIPYYIEQRDDLDKVLDIFIRVNSGGTPLTHSDLLLSIATAQWDNLDARKEIYDLVDELNETRNGFDFSKDFVLKAGLMLCGIKSVGFKVTNFSHENMLVLEEHWDDVGAALRLAVNLISDFGLSRQTLSAHSAVLPLAYYLYARGASDSYRFTAKESDDRERIRYWLIRSLLKPGIWGSGLDTLLTALRTVLSEHLEGGFPLAEVEAEMARRGKSLRFEDEEIDDLVDVRYGDKRAFSTLALLYPFVDLRNEFHVDHVFPRKLLTSRELKKAGVPLEQIDEYTDGANRLANLQLLEGLNNLEKSDRMPADWLSMKFSDPEARSSYCERHDLGIVPDDLKDFTLFYQARRARMVAELKDVLGGPPEFEFIEAMPQVLESVAPEPPEPETSEGDIQEVSTTSKGESADLPERKKLRLKFWSGLLDRARARTDLHGSISPSPSSSIYSRIGIPGLGYEYRIRKHEGAVVLRILCESDDETKFVFAHLLEHRGQIEEVFGEPLDWDSRDGVKAKCVGAVVAGGGYRDGEAAWPAIQDNLIDAMIRLDTVLRPHLTGESR